MRLRSFRPALTACAIVASATTIWGFAFLNSADRWPDGNIVMHLQLGSSGTLLDGSASWNAAFEAALAIWNQFISSVKFTVVRDSTSPIGDGNGVNNVFFSANVYGRDLDENTLAVTTHWLRGSTRTEADIIFNNKFSWNAYRGALRRASGGGFLHELRRVALHESGHALGLDHPNDYGQNVTAQMNTPESDLDTLANDDIAGAQALYGGGGAGGSAGAVVNFPPRNESLDFRNQLEAKYRNDLRRSSQSTFVDLEGDVVWTQEYLRYRVNQCPHSTAVLLVMTEIDGVGTPPICGRAPAGQVNFPPRNESLDFRNLLESKYRDGLRRSPSASAVDNEGAVVWIQEYLRYRVNGCTHGDAAQKVFLQIDGRGVQPVCR